ncbi:MAG: TetR family transcriptional regulator [Oceanospirillales bacterium]|uniref:TetR family transcriptional regulator n=1 Tax=Marinobacterium halophilum TaxID=267374 RepID=A0A2P8F4G5_9GAMM|nr:TetR family transcriptional regulator [Marinobacterium halophilum]MBR9828019.1 TetR family transcriptional regulator [Oceanospirillales bacterium]PSL16610.1 TetR family transcriptional regulator [Marinobacterium halophilum]
MRRTKEEAELTRQVIMGRGLELFAEQGVAATRLSDIAKAAGFTRGAIYWHFKNKWDLFDAICEFYSQPFKTLSDACLSDQEQDPLGKLRELLVRLLCKVEQDRNFCRMMLMFIRESSGVTAGGTAEPVARFMEYQHQRRLGVIHNAIRRGQLPPTADAEAASWLIKAMVDGFVTSWLQRAEYFSISSNADVFVDTVIASLSALQPVPDSVDDEVCAV